MQSFWLISLKIPALIYGTFSILRSTFFFETPFEQQLDKSNRWVQLSNALPWDALAKIYNKKLRSDFGAPGIDARKVIGALIIKHKLCLSDREVIEMITENVYMQYFVGLSSFSTKEIFHHTEFVHIRKRLSESDFNFMTEELMRAAGIIEKRFRRKKQISHQNNNTIRIKTIKPTMGVLREAKT